MLAVCVCVCVCCRTKVWREGVRLQWASVCEWRHLCSSRSAQSHLSLQTCLLRLLLPIPYRLVIMSAHHKKHLSYLELTFSTIELLQRTANHNVYTSWILWWRCVNMRPMLWQWTVIGEIGPSGQSAASHVREGWPCATERVTAQCPATGASPARGPLWRRRSATCTSVHVSTHSPSWAQHILPWHIIDS